MISFNYYLLDTATRLIASETIQHDDILDAFEQMRAFLIEHGEIDTVQLWQDENYLGHIKRSDGRLVLKKQGEPMPTHPLFSQDSAETKAS